MTPKQLTLQDIALGIYQQTHFYWLYTWYRYNNDVYVENQISGDKFLWFPR